MKEMIAKSINAILLQSIKPDKIAIVNDGSTDKTEEILTEKFSNNPIIKILTREDRGYSVVGNYLMADVYNTGLEYLRNYEWDYLIICAGDTILPTNYVKDIINAMGKSYGVASGTSNEAIKLSPSSCRGSGRVINRQIMDGLNGLFPSLYSWEQAPINYSFFIGLKTGHFQNINFTLARKTSENMKSYTGWGKAMKQGGYTYNMAIFRSFKWIIINRRYKAGFQLLYGFFSTKRPKGYDYIDYRLKNANESFCKILYQKLRRPKN